MTTTWQQLFMRLKPIVSCGNPSTQALNYKQEILNALKAYKSLDTDFQSYVKFDDTGYTKNLIEEFGDNCNIIAMCWAPGQASLFHGHENSRCFVKVLSGQVLEQQVPYPSDNSNKQMDSAKIEEKVMKRDEVAYIDDTIGLHKVSNLSQSEAAITLHVYLPAYTKCRVFPQGLSLEESKIVDVTYYQ